MKTFIPENYVSKLDLYETQAAISLIARTFQDEFARSLHLKRVSAPLFVLKDSGLNDDLNGYERAVDFDIKATDKQGVIVHSLAKWKRMALHNYDFYTNKGLYTNMNAIRRDEDLDNLHSIYVDQWDWEKIITAEQRNLTTLKEVVTKIVDCIIYTEGVLNDKYPALKRQLSRDITFLSAQELLDLYPDLDAKEREYRIVKEKKTVFLMGIGHKLSNGEAHDGRAPDYDDWDLNGDLLFYDQVLDCCLEISSMGIRVDSQSLKRQLELTGCTDRMQYKYHQMIANDQLPLTIGGGIGQSRLCMLLMQKAHIGEVQSSIWDEDTYEICKKKNVILL